MNSFIQRYIRSTNICCCIHLRNSKRWLTNWKRKKCKRQNLTSREQNYYKSALRAFSLNKPKVQIEVFAQQNAFWEKTLTSAVILYLFTLHKVGFFFLTVVEKALSLTSLVAIYILWRQKPFIKRSLKTLIVVFFSTWKVYVRLI